MVPLCAQINQRATFFKVPAKVQETKKTVSDENMYVVSCKVRKTQWCSSKIYGKGKKRI